jgi:hypothetical protein
MSTMFCPKCGVGHQTPESYCRSCGEWLPDLDSKSTRLNFGSTREERVLRIRTLELISTGLSLTAAAIVFTFLFTGANQGWLLFLAAAVSIVVAVYQIANMFMGHKVMRGLPRSPADLTRQFEKPNSAALPAPDTNDLRVPASVTEDTTRHLDKVGVKSEHQLPPDRRVDR